MARAGLSIATQLALGYGLLVAAAVVAASAVFYFGTIGLLDRSIDARITRIAGRLLHDAQEHPLEDLALAINAQLADGVDSDLEIYLLEPPAGRPAVGNLSPWDGASAPRGRIFTRDVVRAGRHATARLLVTPLPDGGTLTVGRDLREQEAIRNLVLSALAAGVALSMALVVAGAAFLRLRMDARLGEIRRTALRIEAGDLSQRIPVKFDDELGRLNVDINRMLDRIQQLMDGVRHVSNAIAHDLRTPLARIRFRLEDALRGEPSVAALSEAASAAIEDIDDLILVFEKLLQIAAAESGLRTGSFDAVDLNRLARDMVELYDAAAEEKGMILKTSAAAPATAAGDHDLLASACASLIDNAIKYAGTGTTVEVSARADDLSVSIVVRDNGPGIPPEELPRVTERFYRLDHSRHLPGNGLGLSIVSAIATLHGGRLRLENAHPGLVASIVLPARRAVEQPGRDGAVPAKLSNP